MVKVCPQAMCVAVIANNRKVRSGKVFFMVGGFFEIGVQVTHFLRLGKQFFPQRTKFFRLTTIKEPP